MPLAQQLRTGLALILATSLVCPPAQALVSLNDGRDRIFVSGTFSASHDSNIFANSDGQGDIVYSSGVTAEYVRRAGLIGVNGSVAVSGSHFGEHKEQDFSNPSYSLEFTKQSGRTTGSLTFNGARESRADPAVNMRSTSWNYGSALNVKYPAGIRTFAGSFGYSSHRYLEDTVFADLATYSSSIDMIHILPAERELITGYRYRFSETSRNTSSSDHAVSMGISGKLIRGLVGSIRAGWQARVPHGSPGQPTFSSWTFSGTTSYAFSKRLNAGVQFSKDFSTTATDASVDVTNVSLDGAFTVNRKIGLSFSGGWGMTKFLGEAGRMILDPGPPPLLGRNREDSYVNWSAGLSYAFHERLKLSFNYSWFENWSTSPYADFIRSSWGFSASSRW